MPHVQPVGLGRRRPFRCWFPATPPVPAPLLPVVAREYSAARAGGAGTAAHRPAAAVARNQRKLADIGTSQAKGHQPEELVHRQMPLADAQSDAGASEGTRAGIRCATPSPRVTSLPRPDRSADRPPLRSSSNVQ
jgi:hypothetical protein